MRGLEHVLSPTRIAGLELRNRVVRTAYGTNLGGGCLNDDLIAHHEARARGGVALSIIEATGVHASGPMTLNGSDDSIVPRYAALAARVHAHGMRIFGQLNHLGLAGAPPGSRPWSASALPGPSGLPAIAMSRTQIDAVVDAFASAARRTKDGGLDGVEIHCAHGHLVQQFLSPATNQRDDEYGGDWHGRARLLLAIVSACRAAVGPDFVLGVRVGPEPERMRIAVADCVRIVEELERRRLIDYVSVSQGSIYRPEKIIGAMHEPAGYELEDSRRITAGTQLPTIVTGRIRTLGEADEVVRTGIADLVGMTRAHIADADLVAKSSSGRTADVRPCIACNQGCVGGLERGRLACTVNAEAGRELILTQGLAVARSRNVLVVGGGPAGLEAARVAALRGHRVTLIEADGTLGGALRLARRAPAHGLIGDIADWLIAQVVALRVEIRLLTRLDEVLLATLSPDAVIVATGAGAPAMPPELAWPPARGEQPPAVTTVRELLAAPAVPAVRHAVVVDQLGTYEAIGAAELLVGHEVSVILVSRFARLAPSLQGALVTRPALQRLRRGDFTLLTNCEVAGIDAATCHVRSRAGDHESALPAELVVLAKPGGADAPLLTQVRSRHPFAVVIGEARLPGMSLEQAIRDAYDTAIQVGTPGHDPV